jgi:serine protease inhibitor ecotin
MSCLWSRNTNEKLVSLLGSPKKKKKKKFVKSVIANDAMLHHMNNIGTI